MARLKRVAKGILLLLVGIVAAYFLARGIVFASYGAKVTEEIRILSQEIGLPVDKWERHRTYDALMEELWPNYVDDVALNPALRLQAGYFLYERPPSRREAAKYPEARRPDYDVAFDDRNASDRDKIARALYEHGEKNREVTPYRHFSEGQAGFQWDDRWTPYLAMHLEANGLPLNIIKEAAGLGHGSFYVDLAMSRGHMTRMPHLRMVRGAANILRLESQVMARGGDISGALDNVRLIFRLRRFIQDEPLLASRACAMYVDHLACALLKEVLGQGAPSKEDVDGLLEEMDGREGSNEFARPFLGATLVGLKAFEDYSVEELMVQYNRRAWEHSGLARLMLKLYSRFVWVRPLDELCVLRGMRTLRESSLANSAETREAVTRARRPKPALGFIHVTFLNRRFLPDAAGNFSWVTADADATVRMARTALALSVCRADKGTYPDSLSALVPEYLPEVQIDPFDGQPLRYRREDTGYRLYSVYHNQTDDGGTSGKPKTKGFEGDWVWLTRD